MLLFAAGVVVGANIGRRKGMTDTKKRFKSFSELRIRDGLEILLSVYV
ncbi:MAG: hypothetical protein FWG75_08120 [Cystobacterineae bacterium]|nr:hypothetical protein [Cystobacterineae bacterium]